MNERLRRHLSNYKGFTARATDWKIVFSEEYSGIDQARRREKQIKGWKSRNMIQKLITDKA